MPEVEYLIVYEDMDKHYIVFEKNSETRVVDPILRFVNKYQAYEYFEKLITGVNDNRLNIYLYHIP